MIPQVCIHGYWLTQCATCDKREGECDFGSCTEPAAMTVLYDGYERRPMCADHAAHWPTVTA